MFNVSALLLNDAFLKCVVTEVVGLLFSIVAVKTHHISQGSVTTHLRCGGIFSDSIIANGLLILIVKKFENRSIFDEVKAYKTKCASFLPPSIEAAETEHTGAHDLSQSTDRQDGAYVQFISRTRMLRNFINGACRYLLGLPHPDPEPGHSMSVGVLVGNW